MSLKAYLLVSQSKPRIELFTRSDDGWRLSDAGPGEALLIEPLGVTLTVDALYNDPLASTA